jgi:hypothetical protein
MVDGRSDIKEWLERHEADEFRHEQATNETLKGLREDLETGTSGLRDVQADLKSFVLAGRLIWYVLGGVLALVILPILGYSYSRIETLDEELTEVRAQLNGFEQRGTKWGEQLDADVARIDADVRELRRKINGGKHSD